MVDNIQLTFGKDNFQSGVRYLRLKEESSLFLLVTTSIYDGTWLHQDKVDSFQVIQQEIRDVKYLSR